MSAQTTIWTVGHSNRSWEEFAALLREHSIETLCDVRSWPGSRKYPHFERAALERLLGDEGIAYRWMGAPLGGRRRKGLGPASPNKAIASVGFRNYADHMLSGEFRAALDELIALASASRTAVMCAEAVPERCHRRFLADALSARGVRVVHIVGRGRWREHRPTPGAFFAGESVTYPAQGDFLEKDT